MEMDDRTKLSCSHGEEMLAYLYDELSPEGRNQFEAHMQGCFECIDEFAELAVSRYSVFEWRSVEFAPLATPKFIIPTERKPVAASWLDGFKAMFALNGWAMAGGGAILILFAVIGIAFWNVQPDGAVAENGPQHVTEQIPANVPAVQTPPPNDVPVETKVVPTGSANEFHRERTPPRPIDQRRMQPAVVKASTIRTGPAVTNRTRRSAVIDRPQNSPTLSQYVEDQDDSLRLSDIFDDLDTKDME